MRRAARAGKSGDHRRPRIAITITTLQTERSAVKRPFNEFSRVVGIDVSGRTHPGYVGTRPCTRSARFTISHSDVG